MTDFKNNLDESIRHEYINMDEVDNCIIILINKNIYYILLMLKKNK